MKISSVRLCEPQQLFHDYLYDFDKVKEFYRWNYHDGWQDAFKSRRENYRNRKEVAEILKIQNEAWDAPPAVLRNIEMLGEENTLAIVTGQQTGLGGGPLYTLYKALGAIKLAARLQKQYSGLNFVPVFWMEVNDNDFREIDHFFFLDTKNELVTLQLPEDPDDLRSVYRRTIPAEMTGIVTRMEEISFPSEFRDNILGQIRASFKPGKAFPDAFAAWLLAYLGDRGLVVMNPSDDRLLVLARPLFRQAIEQQPGIMELFNDVNNRLVQKKYSTQITLDEKQTLLFMESDDYARVRLDTADGKFQTRNPRQNNTFSREELLGLVDKEPGRFSPNVALRPLVQDFLLPTAAYVAGPGEISYFAQLAPLYRFFDLVPPVIFPRPRLTLVESKIQRLVNKYGLSFVRLFEEQEKLLQRLIQHYSNEELEDDFSRVQGEIHEALYGLKPLLTEIESGLKSQLDKTAEQIEGAMQKLRQHADQAVKKRVETEIQQLKRIFINLFPDGKYQERVLNLHYYLIKYGPDFIDDLFNIMDISQPDHQLVLI